MTEAEWLACNDPAMMLDCLRGKASGRKLRLFACACVQRMHRQCWPEETPSSAVEEDEAGITLFGYGR